MRYKQVAKCEICAEIETSKHYFFRCNRFVDQRVHLFRATRTVHPMNAHLLLYGNSQLSSELNMIVDAVHQYIFLTTVKHAKSIPTTTTLCSPPCSYNKTVSNYYVLNIYTVLFVLLISHTTFISLCKSWRGGLVIKLLNLLFKH